MKFFDAIKNLFSKDIKIKKDISQYLIYPVKLKRRKIWLNSKIEIPENFVAIITHKKRVLDCLPSGEHVLNSLTLPLCTKKFRLNKLDKYGKQIKNIKTMVFLVNTLEQVNFSFSIKKRLKYKTSIDGKFWVKPNCEVNFSVKDYSRFLKTLLKKCESASALRKPKYVDAILGKLLSIRLFKQLKKNNYLISSFKQNKEHLTSSILPKYNKVISKFGIDISDLQIRNVVFSKSAIMVEELREKLAFENENSPSEILIAENENFVYGNENFVCENEKTETVFTDSFWSVGKSEQTNLSETNESSIAKKNIFMETDKGESNVTWQGLESYKIGQVKEINSNKNISSFSSIKSKPRRFVQLLEH